MTAFDPGCEWVRAELSAQIDEGGGLSPQVREHLENCPDCARFAEAAGRLDVRLGRERFELAPDVSSDVLRRIGRRPAWWSVAAAAVVGLVAGAVLGGVGTSLQSVRAGDLAGLFQSAGPGVDQLDAEMIVVERGWHPDVPERVYSGALHYRAPEGIDISLTDTTDYPGSGWEPNHLLISLQEGDLVTVAAPPCPVAALPACSRPPQAAGISDLRPFADGVISPLAVVGPGPILNRWGGVEVVGAPLLEGKPTIQIETTVAAAGLVQALTQTGAWRELHPADRSVMWLDERTLVPLRTEVFAADTPERDLWELRRGYRDQGDEPIFVVDLAPGAAPAVSTPDVAVPAGSAGFADGPVTTPQPDLDEDLVPYRSGSWLLPDGERVQVSSWSDGRAWLRVEATEGWGEPRLFGIGGSFAEPIELRPDSVAYLSPDGSAVALHGETVDMVVTGSLPVAELVEVAASLPIEGRVIPSDWDQAGVAGADELPSHVLVPGLDGWSTMGRAEGDDSTLLITGAGRGSAVATQTPGDRLDPPDGPDFVAVELDGATARFDIAEQTLEWVEDGWVFSLRSETVGLDDLVALARSMRG